MSTKRTIFEDVSEKINRCAAAGWFDRSGSEYGCPCGDPCMDDPLIPIGLGDDFGRGLTRLTDSGLSITECDR